jgi:hypothetical protein
VKRGVLKNLASLLNVKLVRIKTWLHQWSSLVSQWRRKKGFCKFGQRTATEADYKVSALQSLVTSGLHCKNITIVNDTSTVIFLQYRPLVTKLCKAEAL